jgi:hypothetical protein
MTQFTPSPGETMMAGKEMLLLYQTFTSSSKPELARMGKSPATCALPVSARYSLPDWK